MELIPITTYKHLSIYEEDWLAILKENQNSNPFIEYEFVCNLLKSLEGHGDVKIYAVKEHNRMIAFFPFQLKKTWLGYIVHFLAPEETKIMDIIAKKRDVDRVIMFVFDEIITHKKDTIFHLHGLVESVGTPSKLSKYIKARNMKEQNLTKNNDGNGISKIIFSTSILKAKTYRNFLWVKDTFNFKKMERKG